MKGDFSRIRFEPGKHYTDVLDQQGRVAYDADHNEQRFIDGHRRTVQTIDVIGEYGGPMDDAGFAIGMVNGSLQIGAGRYYVHGLLCENPKALDYRDQPFLIDHGDADDLSFLLDEVLRNPDHCLRVYLEVWQRMVTALDDTCLGEPALGQADTTTRMQTVWRVVADLFSLSSREPVIGSRGVGAASKLPKKTLRSKISDALAAPVAGDDSSAFLRHPATALTFENDCSCEAMYKAVPPAHTGTMSAQVAENGGDCGCQPLPAAGYTGQENQLYRFEIQRAGVLGRATFKWSRENGSVVVAVQSVSGNQVVVESLGPDANLGFQVGQWVELSDDADLFGSIPNLPGQLYQIQHIDRPSMTLTMTMTVQPVDTTRHARMRRWDQQGSSAGVDGIVLSDSWITIENGIQVRFGKGHYFAGDAWTVAARNATGQIDWPPCGSDGNPFQQPHYAPVYRAPLACIKHRATVASQPGGARLDKTPDAYKNYNRFEVDDCRRLFPSLTELGRFVNDKALHITRLNWANDDAMTFDTLIRHGLQITLDQAPTSPLSPANVIVTMETPVLLQSQDKLIQPLADAKASWMPPSLASSGTSHDVFQSKLTVPTTIRSESIIDSLVRKEENVVAWTLPVDKVAARQRANLEAINAALAPWAFRGTPVRVRVKLLGRTIFAADKSGRQLYLDGQTFGRTASSKTLDRERLDLRLPSGNDDRASDFESWFYLYPAISVDSVDFTYRQISIDYDPAIVSTEPAATTQPIVQQATITLNYPPPQATTIQLSMSGDTNIASVPAQVQVAAGQASVTVDVSINGTPAVGSVAQFTLSASMPTVLGDASAQTASFEAIATRFKGGSPKKKIATTQRKAATKTTAAQTRRATTKRKSR